jgi:hypothetical protein
LSGADPDPSYNVDMYMWFKWKDPDIDPSRSFEFLNAFELWGHILTYESDEPERLSDGSYYQVLRNQGKFNAKLPLGRYPFDTQHLVVAVEDSQATKSGIVYVPDTRPIALSEDLTLPGWSSSGPRSRSWTTATRPTSAIPPAPTRSIHASWSTSPSSGRAAPTR